MIDITKEYLIKWINELSNEQKIYRFYQSKEWRQLRADIIHKNYNECHNCRKKGKITKAETVHHIHHLREYPQYALSEYIYKDGEKIINLIPLCSKCHWEEHPEKNKKCIEKNKKKEDITEERW